MNDHLLENRLVIRSLLQFKLVIDDDDKLFNRKLVIFNILLLQTISNIFMQLFSGKSIANP